MSRKFTPGPWRIPTSGNMLNSVEGPSGRTYEPDQLDDGFRTVAMVQDCCASRRADDQDANRDANMALISAAPEMYEALEKFVTFHSGHVLPGHELQHAMELAYAALAKARGE